MRSLIPLLILGLTACVKQSAVQLPDLELAGMERQVAAKITHTLNDVMAHPDDQKKLAQLAMTLQAHGMGDQAKTLYGQLAQLDSQDYRWPYLQAVIASENNLDDARNWFLQAEVLAPTNSGFYVRLGDLHYKHAAPQEAATSYHRALELQPTQAHALLGLARLALDKNDAKAALEYLDRALQTAPHFGQAHRLAARVHRRLGNDDLARDAVSQADQYWLSTKPDDPLLSAIDAHSVTVDAYTLRGLRDMNRGRLKAAKRQFAKAVEYRPNVDTRLNLAEVLQKLGDTEAALEQQTLVLDQDPDNPEAHLAIGLSYISKGEQERGLLHFGTGLEHEPKNPRLIIALADTLIKSGRHIQAITLLREKQSVASPKIKAMLAWELATAPSEEQRDGTLALEIAQTLLNESPSDPIVMDLVAVCHAELGDFESAKRMGEAALAVANTRQHEALSRIFQQRLNLYANRTPYRAKPDVLRPQIP